ncbi:hypothetical protein [Nonomuraea sp. NPDC050783]|uniref:hypothetical protein n=1 Tax=Nonomuraea sp. NPDC050783 TaxID=3154634 RepID=UPI0034655FB0
MVAIGFALLGVGLVVAVLLALADPVLVSRLNGEPAEGGSGRHLNVPPHHEAGGPDTGMRDAAAGVVRLTPRPPAGVERRAPEAA